MTNYTKTKKCHVSLMCSNYTKLSQLHPNNSHVQTQDLKLVIMYTGGPHKTRLSVDISDSRARKICWQIR